MVGKLVGVNESGDIVGDAKTAVSDVALETLQSSPVLMATDGRKYKVVAGVMRNPDGNWAVLDDTIHRYTNVDSVVTDTRIRVNYDSIGAVKVVSFVAVPDEVLVKAGYACSASVSLTQAMIDITRHAPVSDYVQWSAANGWTSLNGVFRNLTFSGGTLTMESDPVGGANLMDLQITGRGGCLASASSQVGGATNTVTKIDFRDYSGALITTPNTDMKAYVSRGSSGAVDPTSITTTRYVASNIWFYGIFEVA